MTRLKIAMLCGLLFPQFTHADADSEQQLLAQLLYELSALQPLINRADENSDQDARVRLNYSNLRLDVELIRLGIQGHLVQPRQQPRQILPLKGDYRQ